MNNVLTFLGLVSAAEEKKPLNPTALLSPQPVSSLPLMKLKCSLTTQETNMAVEEIIYRLKVLVTWFSDNQLKIV